MKQGLYVTGGIAAGVLAGLAVIALFEQLLIVIGLQEANGQQLSLSTLFGLLGFWACVIAGGMLGYRLGSPGPDPRSLRQAARYFDWLREYHTTSSRRK